MINMVLINLFIILYVFCSCVRAGVASEESIWYPYQFGTGYGNREELAITKVAAVNDFKTSQNVMRWRSLSLKHISYAIGLTDNGLTVLQAVIDEKNNASFAMNETHTFMNATVLDARIFEYWDAETFQNEVITIVATTSIEHIDLRWFKIAANNKLIQIWNWKMQHNITHLNLFKIEDKYNLLICNDRHANFSTLDVYRFQLGKKPDFWLVQVIELTTPVKSTAISTYGSNIYLSIPQETKLVILNYNEHHFTLYTNITVEHVRHVSSFKIGFKSFIAIDGFAAGIYKFTNHGLVKQDIIDANLDGIDYWLSIPIRTYRDEEILIAERSLDYGGHKGYVIEVVLYNAGKFTMHEEMTCDYYGDVSNGMNCLVEEANTHGAKGSAFLIIGNVVGIVVPRRDAPSGLFMIHTEQKQLESPVEKQIKALNTFRKDIEARIEKQNSKLAQIKKSIDKSVKVDKENIIQAPWKVDVLSAAVLKRENNVWPEPGSASAAKYDQVVARLENLQGRINDLGLKLQNLNAINAARGNNYENFIVNGPVEVQGPSSAKFVQTNQINGVPVNDVFADIVRLDNMQPIQSQKTFFDLNVNKLNFSAVNTIPAEKLAFSGDSPLKIEGNLIFEEPVHISGPITVGKVNDVILEEEVIQTGMKITDPLRFEKLIASDTLKVEKANKFPIHNNYLDVNDANENAGNLGSFEYDTLYIPGNVTIETLNDDNVGEVISSLCMKNIKTYVPNSTLIEGNVSIVEHAFTFHLKNLKYPDEYIFGKSEAFSQITGNKRFDNIVMDELTTSGTVNSVDPNKVVTLTDDQIIPGMFTFNNITVTETFHVPANITGEQLSKFLPNPLITNTEKILSNLNFKTLEVDGVITISNKFNGTNLRNILSDVVYKDETHAEINSVKVFRNGLTVRKNLNLISNTINNIPIDSFIHKETQEIMQMGLLNGSVTFENLLVKGTIVGVNVTKLETDTVKLSGQQFVSSKLIFEDEITMNDLDIIQSLNEIEVGDYLFTDGDRELEEVNLDNIEVGGLEVTGDLIAEQSNYNLVEFDERRLSYTKEQIISAEYHLEKSKVQILKPVLINGYYYDDIFDVDKYAEKLYGMLHDGKLKIEELIIQDSMNLSSINSVPISEIMKNCIWTNENARKSDMSLKGNIFFKELLVDSFNDVPFSSIIDNIVFKNESDNVKIEGVKVYENGYEVTKYISSPKLNNINVGDILRNSGNQKIAGTIIIESDVLLAENIELMETLNDIPIDYLTDSFEVVDADTYKITGDVFFTRVAYTSDFLIEGSTNGENLTEFLSNVVYPEADQTILGDIIFKAPVSIKANLAVKGTINSVDLALFKDDIVLITKDTTVEKSVKFMQPVLVRNELKIEGNLMSKSVMDMNLQDWIEKAVFINIGKIPGTLTFEQTAIPNTLQADFLNAIPVASLIPLRTNQIIEQPMRFLEMSAFKDIIVQNLVNGYNLEAEFRNTVLSGRIQQITSNVQFQSNVLVEKNLEILGLINNNDINRMVTTNTPQNLTAAYTFLNKTNVEGHAVIYGDVSGVNITKWLYSGVKKYSHEIQQIVTPWEARGSLTFRNNVIGFSTIGNFNVRQLADKVEERRVFKYTVEHDLLHQYRNVCRDINGIVKASRKQIYIFKYLDVYQHLDFAHPVENIHHYEYQAINYILVSHQNMNCSSTLLQWNKHMLNPVIDIETGRIAQVITVRDGDLVFLITRSGSQHDSCNMGTNVWKVKLDSLELLYNIEDQLLLQESLLPGTFYGMTEGSVIEFNLQTITDTVIRKVQRWNIPTENAAFVPRGLKTGVALRDGRNLIKLIRDNSFIIDDDGYNYNTIIEANVSISQNFYLPGRYDGEMLVMNVGSPRRRTLFAIATHEETTIQGKFDFIKIYENLEGKVYHKVPSDNPSSMISLEFGQNGETVLVFLENQQHLQVYEYKGIEGFKYRTTANVEASKLVRLILPCGELKRTRNFIAAINRNRVSIIEAVMDGDQFSEDNIECNL